MMIKIIISGVIGLLLSACGGGGESSAPAGSASPVTALPTVAPPASTPETSQLPVSAPPLAAKAIVFTSPAVRITTDTPLYILVRAVGISNLDLIGKSSHVWISEGQAMDRISITGTSNTLVMMAGSTVTSLTVDPGNTLYLPLDSPITITGTGATVKYYTK